MNNNVLSIDIYGMGGVGKTTTVMHIHNRILKNLDTFGNVYWVTVSQNFSICRLQDDIARKVGLNLLDEDDEMTRASLLSEALSKTNKSILFLDDVWNHIHLERVGIPIGMNGFRLILTTRLLEVCSKMGCQSVIKVEPFSEEEAWNLFKKKLGHAKALPLDIIEIAHFLVKRCGGLPLGINTMATSMRGVNDIHQWRNVLEELKKPTVGQGEIESEAVPVLKSSYSRLKNNILQHCFLYCVLFPEDFEIDREKLIKYFIIEGMMDRSKSRQQEFDMGHTALNELENCCLLESCISSLNRRCVKMHDLTRDMALQIMRESRTFMVKAAVQLSEIPDEHMWTAGLEKVSSMKNEISEIPPGTSPMCPKLQTLLLQENPLKWIADSYFVHMHGLRVLNLSFTWIKDLPNSLSDLENLTALLLRGCGRLTYVPSIGKLRSLRDLDFGRTRIKEVPQDMKGLLNLRCLYMDHMKYLKMLPAGILPRLSHLQQVTFVMSSKHVNVRGEELEGLKQLEEFEGSLHDLCDYNQFIDSLCYRRLRICRLRVGYDHNYPDEFESDKELKLGNCSLKRRGGEEDGLIPPHDIQYLVFDNCHDMSSCLLDVAPSFNNARDLKNIVVSRCDEIESIFRMPSFNKEDCSRLQNLEILRLHDLPNFNSLFKWKEVTSSLPPFGTFFNLKLLHLSRCDKLKKLFTARTLLHLQILEDVRIWKCNQMEEIIADDEEGMGARSSNPSCFFSDYNNEPSITLPKLRKLNLAALPELKSICGGTIFCDSIEEISVIQCQKLRRLPLCLRPLDGKPSPPPALKKIEIHPVEWWEFVHFDNLHAKNVLQPFVSSCVVGGPVLNMLSLI